MLDDLQRNCFANMMAILLFHFSQKYHEEIVEIVVQKWANTSINIFSFFLSFFLSPVQLIWVHVYYRQLNTQKGHYWSQVYIAEITQ